MHEASQEQPKGDEIDVVVSRRVRADRVNRFWEWAAKLEPEIAKFPGLLAFKIVEPRKGIQDRFVVLNRWESAEALSRWENSRKREELFAEADLISEKPAEVQHVTGMQGLFTLPDTRMSVAPPKYKMALVTFAGLFVLSLGWATLGSGLMAQWPTIARVSITVAINVSIMVYFFLPWATRLLFRWLR